MGALTRLNYKVFVYVLENTQARPKGWTCAFSRKGGPEIHVAGSRLAVDPGSSVVFTLGSTTPQIILTVTDGDAERVAAVLAAIEDCCAADASLGAGGLLDVEDAYLRSNGRVAAALLRPAFAFRKFSDVIEFDGVPHRTALAVFLNQEERDLARGLGFAALEERFRLCGRSMTRLASAVRERP